MTPNVIWVSVLLVDDKVKFWRISPNRKSAVGDFYKDFYYSGESMDDYIHNSNCRVENTYFIETEDRSANTIHNEVAPIWINMFGFADNYKGQKPGEPGAFVPVGWSSL